MEYFVSLPIQTQIIIVVSFLIAAIFLVFLVYRRGVRVGGKGITLSIPGSDQNKTLSKTSPHANCKHRHDAIDTVQNIFKNSEHRNEIRNGTSVKLQMNVAELYIKRLISDLRHIYLIALKGKGFEDPVSEKSYHSYSVVLELLEARLMAEIQYFIKEDSFVEKSAEEFEKYIKDKTNLLIDFGTDLLNKAYLYNEDITRTELYEKNSENVGLIKKMASDFFYECRGIAEKIETDVKLLESKTEILFNRFKS